MEVGRVDRGLQIHSMIDHMGDHLQDCVCDRCPARRPNRKIKAAIGPKHKRRRHRREGTLPRRDRVTLTLDGPIKIWGARLGGEVVHFIVKQHSGPFRDHAGAEPAV